MIKNLMEDIQQHPSMDARSTVNFMSEYFVFQISFFNFGLDFFLNLGISVDEDFMGFSCAFM